MSESKPRPPLVGDVAEREMQRLTRRSLLTGAAAALTGLGAWHWLRTTRQEGELPWPLRRALRFNQELGERLFSNERLAPTFPATNVRGPARTNGLIGVENNINTTGWSLRIE